MFGKQANEWLREDCGLLSDTCDATKVEFPEGWDKVPSRSRPGQFSFKHLASGDVYDAVPHWAWEEELKEVVEGSWVDEASNIFRAPNVFGSTPKAADESMEAEQMYEEYPEMITEVEEEATATETDEE